MRSIDTNIAVRLLTRDDPTQLAVAEALLQQQELFLPLTVVLETEWVLRGAYGYDRKDIAARLLALSTVENIWMEADDAVAWALARYEHGADFADMIHLIASEGTDAFVTFDQKLSDAAGSDAPIKIETLGG